MNFHSIHSFVEVMTLTVATHLEVASNSFFGGGGKLLWG